MTNFFLPEFKHYNGSQLMIKTIIQFYLMNLLYNWGSANGGTECSCFQQPIVLFYAAWFSFSFQLHSLRLILAGWPMPSGLSRHSPYACVICIWLKSLKHICQLCISPESAQWKCLWRITENEYSCQLIPKEPIWSILPSLSIALLEAIWREYSSF